MVEVLVTIYTILLLLIGQPIFLMIVTVHIVHTVLTNYLT